MKKLVKIFKALGNESRVKIVLLLQKEGKKSVGQIARAIHIDVKATSQHLKILDSTDLMRREKIKNYVYYSLVKFPQDSLRRKVADIIEGIK